MILVNSNSTMRFWIHIFDLWRIASGYISEWEQEYPSHIAETPAALDEFYRQTFGLRIYLPRDVLREWSDRSGSESLPRI